MSKVAIQGNASGTGTFTIAAPNSNTDRTLTLPDEAGTVLTGNSSLNAANLTGTLPAIDGSALTGLSSGLAGADHWCTNAQIASSGQADITNWVRPSISGGGVGGYVGTGMSHSSGIFTFPQTGYWLIISNMQTQPQGGGDAYYSGNFIFGTVNNSTYYNIAQAYGSNFQGNAFQQIPAVALFDVTSTANCKIKIRYDFTARPAYVKGDSGDPRTTVTFLRLGDT